VDFGAVASPDAAMTLSIHILAGWRRGRIVHFLTQSLSFAWTLRLCSIWMTGLLAGLLAASAGASGALTTIAPDSAERVDVLSIFSGGVLAPKRAYHTFFMFLRNNLQSFAEGGGTVRTEYVFSGPHVFQIWSHSARVKAGKADAFSNSTKRRCTRTMRALIDPFLAAHPRGRVVLGGHSDGTVEMQCLKELVEQKYGKQVVAAAYALSPVARKLDNEVAVMTGRHDFMVPFSDFVYPGKAVRGTTVTVPGLDHFMIQNSPDARKLLAEYFVSRSRQSWDTTNRSGISPHY
jgi:hypothetical protein